MIIKQDGNNFVLVLKKGEKLVGSLQKFAKEKSINSAWVSGLGATLEAEVGYYRLDTKDYHFVQLDSILEIVSLSGNLVIYENEPMAHLHVVLSDESMKTYGGHLKEAVVGGTVELYIRTIKVDLVRQTDAETGLKLIS